MKQSMDDNGGYYAAMHGLMNVGSRIQWDQHTIRFDERDREAKNLVLTLKFCERMLYRFP